MSAETFLKNSPTIESGVECNLYDKMFGMCQGGIKLTASYTAAFLTLAASFINISTDQSM